MATKTQPPARLVRQAEKIANRLFIAGNGVMADRLVLLKGDRDLGGWCRQAVIDQIVSVLKDEARAAKKRKS